MTTDPSKQQVPTEPVEHTARLMSVGMVFSQILMQMPLEGGKATMRAIVAA